MFVFFFSSCVFFIKTLLPHFYILVQGQYNKKTITLSLEQKQSSCAEVKKVKRALDNSCSKPKRSQHMMSKITKISTFPLCCFLMGVQPKPSQNEMSQPAGRGAKGLKVIRENPNWPTYDSPEVSVPADHGRTEHEQAGLRNWILFLVT